MRARSKDTLRGGSLELVETKKKIKIKLREQLISITCMYYIPSQSLKGSDRFDIVILDFTLDVILFHIEHSSF